MNLNDMLQRTLENILKDCDIVKCTPISNGNGDIIKIIIEYVPNN